MTVETANRVQLAAAHWKPRFVANGIDVNDFERALATVAEWKDWAPYWRATEESHEALADAAARAGHRVTATEAYQRAAWSYHLGKFLWFEDRGVHEDLARRTVEAYRSALPGLDPAGERVELPFEGAVVPGNLRRPRGLARPPLVLMVPGLDSVKEELFAMENDFLKRGLATLSVDGPGQGENERRFPIRADWSGVVTAIIDGLLGRDDLDLARLGLMGISMGGIYGPFAAAKEKRLRAVVALAGPYDLSECWPALNPLTKGGYVYYTHSRDEAEAFEKARHLSLKGVIDQVDCPLLVIHGAKDRLFPPEQAERIAREAKHATLLMYPEGNHVCNNITYKYRPAMADWMTEQLAA